MKKLTLTVLAITALGLAGCTTEPAEDLIPAQVTVPDAVETTTDEVVDTGTPSVGIQVLDEDDTIDGGVEASVEVDPTTSTTTQDGDEVEEDLSSEAEAELEWVTYSNEEYGFSFEYPSGSEVDEFNVQARASSGKQWRGSLDNNSGDTIFIFSNTNDYTDSEGEGSIQYYAGERLDFSQSLEEQFRSSGISIVDVIENTDSSVLLIVQNEYVSTTYSLMYVHQDSNKELEFISVNSPQFQTLDDYENGTLLEVDSMRSYIEFIKQFNS